MNLIKRLIASMTALITGFTFLLTAAFQGGTGIGFDKKSEIGVKRAPLPDPPASHRGG